MWGHCLLASAVFHLESIYIHPLFTFHQCILSLRWVFLSSRLFFYYLFYDWIKWPIVKVNDFQRHKIAHFLLWLLSIILFNDKLGLGLNEIFFLLSARFVSLHSSSFIFGGNVGAEGMRGISRWFKVYPSFLTSAVFHGMTSGFLIVFVVDVSYCDETIKIFFFINFYTLSKLFNMPKISHWFFRFLIFFSLPSCLLLYSSLLSSNQRVFMTSLKLSRRDKRREGRRHSSKKARNVSGATSCIVWENCFQTFFPFVNKFQISDI